MNKRLTKQYNSKTQREKSKINHFTFLNLKLYKPHINTNNLFIGGQLWRNTIKIQDQAHPISFSFTI
jgi:hypothetical protein